MPRRVTGRRRCDRDLHAAAGRSGRTSSSARMACARWCAPAWRFPARFATPATPRGAASPPFRTAGLLAGETLGCGQRFGLVPIAGDRVYWYATDNVPEGGARGTRTREGAAGRDVRELARAHSGADRGHRGGGDPPQRHLRSRPGRSLGRGARHAARRRGASDDAEPRAGRLPGDRRRAGAGALSVRRRARSTRRCAATSRCGSRGRDSSSTRRGGLAGRSRSSRRSCAGCAIWRSA